MPEEQDVVIYVSKMIIRFNFFAAYQNKSNKLNINQIYMWFLKYSLFKI